MQKAQIPYVIILFFIAAIMEIGGGYLVWQTLRGNRPLWLGIAGGLLLAGYGYIAAQQPAGFGRTYAAYGGVFVVMSLLWAWRIDKSKPDIYDCIGAIVVLIGIAIIFFTPRK